MKVLALTDHDTMSGIPEAMEAARRFGIKIIPGVEISTIFYSRLFILNLSPALTKKVPLFLLIRPSK